MDRLKNFKNADAKKQPFFRSAKYFLKKGRWFKRGWSV